MIYLDKRYKVHNNILNMFVNKVNINLEEYLCLKTFGQKRTQDKFITIKRGEIKEQS